MKKTEMLCTFASMYLFATAAIVHATTVGTAFTYQGHLKQGGNALDASADFQFSLFDAPLAGSQIGNTQSLDFVTVAGGLFTVDLDFGAGAFGSEERWMQIAVRSPAGGGTYTTLTPRQAVRPAPLAQFALSADGASISNLNASNISSGTVPSSALNGTYAGVLNFANPSNSYSGSGANLTSLNASSVSSGTLPSARLSGAYSSTLTFSNASNSFVGSGAGLNNLNASNIASGTLSNARTTGTALNLPNTLVVRDGSGNFAAGTMTGIHVGNGSGLTELNATNITAGTLADARMPISVMARLPDLAPGGQLTLAGTSSDTGGTVDDLGLANGYAFTVHNTFKTFDLTNPFSPALVNSFSPSSAESAIVVDNNRAYTLAFSELRIYDVGNPLSPTLLGAAAVVNARGLAISGNFAYLAVGGNLVIYNISNPASPAFAGQVATAANSFAVTVAQNRAYVASGLGAGTGALSILNVSNPSSPSLLGSLPTGTGNNAGPTRSLITVFGNYVAILGNPLLVIVDVTNPTSPSIIGSMNVGTAFGHRMIRGGANGSMLFISSDATLRIVDVSNPANPTLVATALNPSSARGLGLDGPNLYAASDVTPLLHVYNTAALSFTAPISAAKFIGNTTFLGNMTGNAAGLTNLNAANLVGAIGNAALSGTYSNPVTFANASNSFAGNGAGLSNLSASSITGILPSSAMSGTYSNNLTFSNSSNSFTGNGAGLTSLNAFNISTGTIANARTSGTSLNTPNTLVLRDASGNFVAGTMTGTHAGNGAGLTDLNAGNITIGTISAVRLPTGGIWQLSSNLAINGANVGLSTNSPDQRLSVNGNASKTGGGSWATFSDMRLKKNIQPLHNSLDQLLALRGVTFEYIDPASIHEKPGTRIGMIAQDVEQVFPDWVGDTPRGYKSLSFSGFEALTVEALRDLRIEKDAQIESLRAEKDSEIESLRNELAELRHLLEKALEK